MGFSTLSSNDSEEIEYYYKSILELYRNWFCSGVNKKIPNAIAGDNFQGLN